MKLECGLRVAGARDSVHLVKRDEYTRVLSPLGATSRSNLRDIQTWLIKRPVNTQAHNKDQDGAARSDHSMKPKRPDRVTTVQCDPTSIEGMHESHSGS